MLQRLEAVQGILNMSFSVMQAATHILKYFKNLCWSEHSYLSQQKLQFLLMTVKLHSCSNL